MAFVVTCPSCKARLKTMVMAPAGTLSECPRCLTQFTLTEDTPELLEKKTPPLKSATNANIKGDRAAGAETGTPIKPKLKKNRVEDESEGVQPRSKKDQVTDDDVTDKDPPKRRTRRDDADEMEERAPSARSKPGPRSLKSSRIEEPARDEDDEDEDDDERDQPKRLKAKRKNKKHKKRSILLPLILSGILLVLLGGGGAVTAYFFGAFDSEAPTKGITKQTKAPGNTVTNPQGLTPDSVLDELEIGTVQVNDGATDFGLTHKWKGSRILPGKYFIVMSIPGQQPKTMPFEATLVEGFHVYQGSGRGARKFDLWIAKPFIENDPQKRMNRVSNIIKIELNG